MSAPHPELLLADEDEVEHPSSPARVENPCHERRSPWHGFVTRGGDDTVAQPPWAVRLSLAGVLFVGAGALITFAALVVHPLQNLDVLCSGVTLAVAGGVLRSIGSPGT